MPVGSVASRRGPAMTPANGGSGTAWTKLVSVCQARRRREMLADSVDMKRRPAQTIVNGLVHGHAWTKAASLVPRPATCVACVESKSEPVVLPASGERGTV